MEKLDGKFHGVIVRDRDGQVEPPDSWCVFVARDDALLPTLDFYYQECERRGAGPEQLAAISRLFRRVERWRKAQPEACKVPDAEPGECH